MSYLPCTLSRSEAVKVAEVKPSSPARRAASFAMAAEMSLALTCEGEEGGGDVGGAFT